MPSAFAVLRLIINSYFVGACTGRLVAVLALEDAIDVTGGAAVLIDRVCPIGEEGAGEGERGG